MNGYAHPEVLVSTDWVKESLGQPGIRIVEIDVDTQAYATGHIPGAIGWNWQTQLQQQVRRDILTKREVEAMMGASGIVPSDTFVLYGDSNNWFAAYGFWLLKVYGHADVRLMNGGRVKWLAEGLPQPAVIAVLADAAQVNTWQAPASPEHPMLEEWYYIDNSSNQPNGHFRHARKAVVLFGDQHSGLEDPVPGSLDPRLPEHHVGRFRPELLTLP